MLKCVKNWRISTAYPQAPFPTDFLQSPHQEMVPAGPALQRAERVFHHRTATALFAVPRVDLHAFPVALQHRLVSVPIGFAAGGLGGDATLFQRAVAAMRLGAGVALDQAPALQSRFAAFAQNLAGGSAVGVRFGSIREVALNKTPLLALPARPSRVRAHGR